MGRADAIWLFLFETHMTFLKSFSKLARIVVAGCAFAATAGAYAAYPDHPVTIVVPYSPGGAADAVARVVASRLSVKLGTGVIVDNKPGASGTIGAGYVAKAAPDGYTVLYEATPHSINPHLFGKMPYAPDALEPLSEVLEIPNVLIVRPQSPFKTVQDLVAQAKAHPGRVNFASGGSGTVQRMAAEMFRQKLNLDMVHVPYKSGGPAITDVMSGQVDFMFGTIAATAPLVNSGKLRALAISAPKRSELLPNVPTVAETVIPGFEAVEWHGMFVPKGTPAPLVDKLHQALADVLQEPEVKQRFAALGATPIGSTPAEFGAYLKKEDAKWGEVVRKGKITLD
jgi:tripartite-type tricarboxylate transporter receptor subunit TctC